MFAGKKQPLQEKIYISPFQLALICSIMKASEKETGGQTLSALNIAVFTGLFDPVTVDQISRCLSVSASENADLILLCLTEGSAGASAEDRWRMLTAACAGNKRMLPVSLIQQHQTCEWRYAYRSSQYDSANSFSRWPLRAFWRTGYSATRFTSP